ncbi:MAG: 6,7-dimethyl-8-ribityllumazine synthase [Elusimicrobia bacterium]|nr:6,7-dimethyl-8-ribityllumazine synthase [Elusimicrobiota bacterium]MDE2236505.1 6,7-dimethyl-8-ribityllumazine synthase [Elusimicrobiota bacterium]MDE2424679.1 6,7-dimethyl-8-ribityllumazine synthase [Elusimicrobiota bacterium]
MKASVAVVVSRFNEEVTSRLSERCLATLKANGVQRARVIRVPGAYELPWAAQELALSKRYAVVIALGCVIKGDTEQNRHISRSVIQALQHVALLTRVPVILGVITPDTRAQALLRTRGKLDRGREAALAALEMLALRRELAHGA